MVEREHKPSDYYTNSRDFGLPFASPSRLRTVFQWPQDASAKFLREALLQHHIAMAINDFLHRDPRKPSLARIADGGRVDLRHLRRALIGEVRMQLSEVATVASASPEALPDPESVHKTLTTVTVLLRKKIVASGQGLPGVLGLMSADQIAAEATLGALQGFAMREVPADEEANEEVPADEEAIEEAPTEDVATVAGPILGQAALRQAEMAGLLVEPTATFDAIGIRPSNEDAPAGLDGCYDPDGPILRSHLPRTWVEDVHDRGWAVIDGHFIVQVGSLRSGRPHAVLAMRLYPEMLDRADTEWLYRADPAIVTGENSRPTLVFEGAPHRR